MTSGWSRRQVLGGLAAAGALWSLDGRAEGPTTLSTATLADPDFDRLRAVSPYVVGVRPHRVGGVRLELEAEPLAGPAGLRNLIHNYGHGGAGITLAWGCAAAATGLVAEAMARLPTDEAPQIAIVGTGVIGLTTATEIRRRWPTVPVTVYAKDLDLRATTSYLAGGQFEPSGVWREYTDPARKEVLAALLRASRDRLVELHQCSDAYGVLPRLNYALDHEIPSIDTYTPADVVPTFKTGALPFSRLNVVGREYQTWLVNPTILLPKLADELVSAGVCFEQRAFGSRADLGALPQNIVVNCTGYGAKALVGDDKVVAQRGHLVVLDKTSELQNYLFSGGCENRVVSYVFCRQTDIVVGGTIFRGEDSAAISPADAAVFSKVLANARSVFAGHPEVCRA